MKVYRDVVENGIIVKKEVFDIIECTYSGKFMGERSISANIEWASPIDFKAGDYIDVNMQSLVRNSGGAHGDTSYVERFYIYTMPTIKKTARANTHGKGFEHNIMFYPAQHELACVQMRDMGNATSADSIIYTGFDTVTFNGGAFELMERIMMVLKEAYHDKDGNPLWSYEIANEVNEQKNTALERFTFSFSGNTVMDALLKLSDKEGINTTFFVNNRKIYVGFKRPYFCRVTDTGLIDTEPSSQMFSFKYGKTSHLSQAVSHGGLYSITKSIGKELPITKLFAYGASRNLNRYYCSDRVLGGRYVNRVMLPSFDADGKTDYILSEDGIERFGIREASKQFEDIYPSLQYITYGDLRTIKYCIKVKASGLENDSISNPSINIARVQCYKIVENADGINTLEEAAPPDDLAIYVHAEGKIVKVVLFGGATNEEALNKQLAHDGGKVPTKTYGKTDYINGSCFLVHDDGFGNNGSLSRNDWFNDPKSGNYTEEEQEEIKLHQINYTDTLWLSDLYIFESYDQTYFSRDGYSAWAWSRINGNYRYGNGNYADDTTRVNTILGVEPITIVDTNLTAADLDKQQKTFDIYLGDVGFKIDEQNDFGEMVFVMAGTVKVSILDGLLAGREFEINGAVTDSQFSCVCAYNEDGTINDEFFLPSNYSDATIPQNAFNNGAIWRLRLNRVNLDEPNYSNLNIAIPNTQINANAGDHVVLLDIFMPDIYIHAAENRLLREAKKHLDANDNGSISYSVELDKVRMHQIPEYALQMREGLNIRVEDSDLDIATINKTEKLFEGSVLTNTSMFQTKYEESTTWYSYIHTNYYELKRNLSFYEVDGVQCVKDDFLSSFIITNNNKGEWEGDFSIHIQRRDVENNKDVVLKDNKLIIRLADFVKTKYINSKMMTNNYIILDVKEYYYNKSNGIISGKFIKQRSTFFPLSNVAGIGYSFYGVGEYDIRQSLEQEGTEITPNKILAPSGSIVYAPSSMLISFSKGKHYSVTIEAYEKELLDLDENGKPKFVLSNALSGDMLIYEPVSNVIEEDINAEAVRYRFYFDLDDSFNDSVDYYPCLVYVSDNNTENVTTKLTSVIQSELEGNENLSYADLTIDTLTINIYDSSNRTYAQPVKEISATLTEQLNATAWASLMNRVENTEKEGEHNKQIYQEIVQSARRHYQTLLNLRNAIFDPDGKCDQTFLQVMMLQVGADSMNYQLLNTRVGLTDKGEQRLLNCSCKRSDDGYYHFIVNESDELNHFVFVEGDNKGTWKIPNGIDVKLIEDGDGLFQPYFISIKCPKEKGDAQWICETKQRKLDEDQTVWYFNWGILTPDSAGVYTLVETRGNAYMYGDNLICGKISDLAKRSFFDLTRGEFVLGDNGDGTAALKYVNGVLTIGGVPNEETINGIINELLGKRTIGGKNLLSQTAFYYKYKMDEVVAYTKILSLDAGKTYVASYGKFEDNAYVGDEEWAKGVCLVVVPVGNVMNANNIESVHKFGEPIEVNYNGRDLFIAWGEYDYIKYVIGTDPQERAQHEFTQYLDEVMVQEGTTPTAFQPSIDEELSPINESVNSLEYLKTALENETTVAGGLLATSVILLRDGDKVTAGISGVKDDNILLFGGGSYDEAVNAASPDNDFHVGENKTGRQITTLIKKDGQGKIGIFKITDMQAVIDVKDKGRIIIDAAEGNVSIFDKDGNERVEITSSDIDKDSADIRTFSNPIEYSDYIPIKYPDDTNKGELVFQSITLKEKQQYVLEQDDFLTHMYLSYLIIYNNNTLSNVNVKFKVAIKSNSSQKHLLCSVDYNIPDGVIPTYREGMLKIPINKIASGIRAPKLFGDVEIGIYDVMATGDVAGYGTNLQLGFSTKKIWFGSENASDKNMALIESELYNIRARIIMNEKTIIGNNGFQVQNKNGLVQILNYDDEGTYVRMLGLPQWSGNLEKGRLCYLRGEDSYLHLVIKENEPT